MSTTRSAKSIIEFGILSRFSGVAVQEAYSAYDQFAGATHALCNVHIVRELTGIGEFDPAAREDGWAEKVLHLLGDAHRWVAARRRDGHDHLPGFTIDELRSRYDQVVTRALKIHPPRRGTQTPARNLAPRLQARKDEFLWFTTDFAVGFWNTTAEQAIGDDQGENQGQRRLPHAHRRPDLPHTPGLYLHRPHKRSIGVRRAP